MKIYQSRIRIEEKKDFLKFLFRKGFVIKEEELEIFVPNKILSIKERYACDFLDYNFGYIVSNLI